MTINIVKKLYDTRGEKEDDSESVVHKFIESMLKEEKYCAKNTKN